MFFVVMRGEYDALLRWPFVKKSSLDLLTKTGSETRMMHFDLNLTAQVPRGQHQI